MIHDSDIKIAFVGDCSNWNQDHIVQEDIPVELRGIIRACDIFIFNLEGPIINETIQPKGIIKSRILKFFLRIMGRYQPLVTNTEKILDVLNLTPHNVACLANNHMRDANGEGINYTFKMLQLMKYQHIGAGMNCSEASRPLVLHVKNKTIGVLNYNFIGWKKFGFFIDPFAAGSNQSGVNHGNQKKVMNEIELMKHDVDYLIVVLHIGNVRQPNLSPRDEKFVTALKADIVIVHHPHISQTVDSDTVFSLGDFIFLSPNSIQNRVSKLLIWSVGKEIQEIELTINTGLPVISEQESY